MSFNINTNLGALDAYNALAKINASTTKAQLNLATQKRINSVADDTSGYRVGKELQGKITLMQSAQGNIGSAKNILSTAESALSNINDLLNQIDGKVADANDPAKNKDSIAKDVLALGDEIKSIFTNTKFNSTALLSGSDKGSFSFKTGESETTTIAIGDLTGLTSLGSITTGGSGAVTSASVGTLDVTAMESAVKDALGSIGNYTQRLDVKSDYLTSAITNATASVSRLFDADMAMEQLTATKGSIGGQVATSMLSQLNSAPQNILSLFR
jgi:flagellin